MPLTTGFVFAERQCRALSSNVFVLAAAVSQNIILNQETNFIAVYATAQTLVSISNAASVVTFQALIDPATPLLIYIGVAAATVTFLSTPGGTLYFNQRAYWGNTTIGR